MVKVTIDGITVEVPAEATILQAAMKAGVDIPYFCYHPFLKPAGLCRMCLVEVEGVPKLQPACVTQVRDGMVVKTNTERVKIAREGIIEFQLLHHPLDCPICDQAGECQLQDITFRYGKTTSRFVDEKELYPTKFYGPLIVHEQSRCILCKRCVRFSTEVMGGADWNVYWRAAHSLIGSYESDKVANYFTGNLVEVCPVGAITSRLYRYKTRIWKLDFTRSVCDHCEIGCFLDLGVRESQLFKVKHNMADPTPWICDKGYYAFDFVNHAERILYPLKRNGEKMVVEKPEDIVPQVADRLRAFKGDEVAFLISPSTALEDVVALKDLADKLGAKVEYRVYGEDYLPVDGGVRDLSEIEDIGNVLVVGGDVGVSHPVLALHLAALKQNGVNVAVLSANDTFLGERASVFALLPVDKEESMVEKVLSGNIPSGLNLTDEEEACLRSMLSSDKLLIVVGVRASSQLRKKVYELKESKGWKALFLDRGTNAKGLASIGAYGDSVGSILDQAIDGKIKALVVSGVDLFATYPDYIKVKKALEHLDFLVVADLFFHETAAYSDFFLPLVSFAEDENGVVDLFWRVRRRRQAMQPKGDSQSLRKWLSQIAEVMGYSINTGLESVEIKKIEEPLFDAKGRKIENGKFVALVEDAFYRSARYAGWCFNFSEAADYPKAYLSIEDANGLGIGDGDKIIVFNEKGSFEFVASLREGQPKGSVVLDGGFERFPVNMLLSGSWVTTVDLKKA
ncbi:2Fe-2S iron-sulfur cluster-binding protein [Thermosulfidibacter takaii]|nr:2Fe-2S iron-sulfur cluster-binding protein [Thermosulfidibacter takaii]